jgi:uncharacterized delta-60 repeat protein
MNRKALERVALAILSLGLAQCSPNSSTTQGPPTAFAVARLTANGGADMSFGGGAGIVVTNVDPPMFDFALAVAIQADNKIIAGGSDGLGGQGRIALVRYNTDGTLDTTGFGGGTGIVFTTLASPASASAIAIQPDTKILVAALTFVPASSATSITLLRYNTDGTLDTTGFGAPQGSVNAAIGTGLAGDVCALALQGDGKIVVAGASQDGKLVLYRYNTDGTPDTTGFGDIATPGKTTTVLGTNSTVTLERPVAMALQSDGRIIVATRSNDDQALLRYNTNGALDTNFGPPVANGIVITDVSGSVNYANAVVVQGSTDPSPDKIVVAGHAFINGADISVTKYSKDGVLDTTFNLNGILATGLGSTDNAFAVLLQTQLTGESKILVSGNFGQSGTSQIFVQRLNPDGTPDATFGVQGQTNIPRFGPSNNASGNAMALQTTGSSVNIVVAGYD